MNALYYVRAQCFSFAWEHLRFLLNVALTCAHICTGEEDQGHLSHHEHVQS